MYNQCRLDTWCDLFRRTSAAVSSMQCTEYRLTRSQHTHQVTAHSPGHSTLTRSQHTHQVTVHSPGHSTLTRSQHTHQVTAHSPGHSTRSLGIFQMDGMPLDQLCHHGYPDRLGGFPHQGTAHSPGHTRGDRKGVR
jgi:hypothetical protein